MKETNFKYFLDYFESSTKLILKRNVISYVQFLISISVIDISTIYTYYFQSRIQFSPNFVDNSKAQQHKILLDFQVVPFNKNTFNHLSILGRMSYFSIFLLLLEEIEIQVKPWQHFLEKFLMKIGFLAYMINQQSLLDIFIGTNQLIQEIEKIIYIFRFHNQKVKEISQNNFPQDPTKVTQKLSKLELIPCFKISKKSKTITYSDQCFQVSTTILDNEQNIDEIILEKITFHILNQERGEKFFQFLKSSIIHKGNFQNSISSHSNCDKQDETNFSDGVNLKNFIINHELKKQQNPEVIQNQYFEFIAKYQWNENILTLYSGKIFIQDNDDEVILQLIDITKQCLFQEKLIKEEFQTTIIQSFSHELRTPLNSSLNFLQYCENDKILLDDIKQNFISPAINALRLQSYLISDIIDFCQLQSDNLELDIQCFSIQQIVDEVNKIFKSALQMKNLALYFDLTKNYIPQIGTDYSRFMQILANLIQNSIKYSNQGMIVIKITSPTISYVKISIKDEGFGIDLETLQKIDKLIQNIEQKKFLSQFDNWQGFGISITMLLLQKLKPEGLESFKIKSNKQSKGTKVTFLIKNYITTNLFSSLFKESKNRKSSRLAASIHSCSKNCSMNGSIVQLSDPENLYSKKGNFEKIFMKKTTNKNTNLISQEDSSKSNSIPDINFELKIGEFKNLYPFQHTQNSNSYLQVIEQEESPENNSAQILQYEYLKNIKEEEDELQLKNFFMNKNCTCKKVLSVDDEVFNQKSIQFLLRQKGFEVILAYNGQEAIQIIQQQQKCCPTCSLFIFILMDYQMPIMNGPTTTKILVEMMNKLEIPIIQIIGVTAFNSKNDIEYCLKSGMKAVLKKPLQIAELFNLFQTL